MLICTGIFKTLGELFRGMSLITLGFGIVGMMLLFIELFSPSHGIFGSIGLVLWACGIVVRMLAGGTVLMLFIMLFICIAIGLCMHMLMLIFQKRAWLTHALELKLRDGAEEDAQKRR